MEVPNPGSREARKWGCTCPVKDNFYGKGRQQSGGFPHFWIAGNCPMHSNVWGINRQYPEDPLDKKIVEFLDDFAKDNWENISRTGFATDSQYYVLDIKEIFKKGGWNAEHNMGGTVHNNNSGINPKYGRPTTGDKPDGESEVKRAYRHNVDRKSKKRGR